MLAGAPVPRVLLRVPCRYLPPEARGRVAVTATFDTFDGAIEVARSHGLAAVFDMRWATAKMQVEVMVLNYDGDLLGK